MAKEQLWEKYRFVHKLPYQPYMELCRILNADGKWREFGGKFLHLDMMTLTLIGQSIHRDSGGPSYEILQICSERNWQVDKLFAELAKMKHLRAMTVLKPYVNPKYHCLMDPEYLEQLYQSTLSPLPPSDSRLPQPVFPQEHRQQNYNLHNSACYRTEAATGEFESRNFAKFQADTENLNVFPSTVRLPPKVTPQDMYAERKIPSKKNSTDGDSLLDNLAYPTCSGSPCEEAATAINFLEKEKNFKKNPIPVSVVGGKPSGIKGFSRPDQGFVSLSSMEEALPDRFQIPYRELLKATDKFSNNRLLGRGGFGMVFKGEWKGIQVAIKRLHPQGQDVTSKHQVSQKQLINELKILYECRFDNILPLYGVSVDGPELCLVYQFMPNGSLEDHLLCKNSRKPLNWLQRSNIAEGTAKGLNYLHTTPGKPLIHGDIKSANILLDANMEAKIGDFGLTREGPDSQNTHVKVTTVHGTQVYLPYEYLRDRHLSSKVDVYSYGIVLLEMATGLRPFDNKREGDKHLVAFVEKHASSGCDLSSICDRKAGEEGKRWFQGLIDIGLNCASKQKKNRPEMEDVLMKINDVKEELAAMPKVRRPTPLELQLFHDQRQKFSNNPTEEILPHRNDESYMNQFSVPPSLSDFSNLEPPNCQDDQDPSSAATFGSSRGYSISPTDRVCNPVSSISSSSVCQAPVPNLSILFTPANQGDSVASESLSSAGQAPLGVVSEISSGNCVIPD